MIRNLILAVSLLSVLVFVSAGAPVQQGGAVAEKAGPYNTLLITNVTVIDGSGAPAYGPANITIKNNIIDRIERSDLISASRGGATAVRADRVIDGQGMFVMPGIVDGHTHINSNATIP